MQSLTYDRVSETSLGNSSQDSMREVIRNTKSLNLHGVDKQICVLSIRSFCTINMRVCYLSIVYNLHMPALKSCALVVEYCMV